MIVQELPMREYYAHLRRHPIPEIMDDACLAAVANVEAQYGNTITHGAGLEVRLGEQARYVDYIMNIDVEHIPFVSSLWYEIDYAEFAKGGPIEPCLFTNLALAEHSYSELWDKMLPPFMGERRARRLRAPLDRVTAALPKGASIKQIGTMSGRGELDIMRLVIIFSVWESVFDGLKAIGWQGSTEALREALEPWKETKNVAVNIDLGEAGVLPKIGIEVCSNWRHPLLMDKFIARLEEAGLCLPSKGEALRRWIRIRPDGDPFIQTLIAYFKLNYKDGRITEAKAYLEQSPYIHHHYFDAYDRPLRLDMELAGGQKILPVGKALALIRECGQNRVRHVRLTGGVAGYKDMPILLQESKKQGVATEIVIRGHVQESWLAATGAAGADAFLVDMEGAADVAARTTLQLLQKLRFSNVRARWYMHRDNTEELKAVVETAAGLGVQELLITGAKPQDGNKMKAQLPDWAQMEAAAAFIREYEGSNGVEDILLQDKKMHLTVESCFSQFRAFMGGTDARYNDNQGIGRGCEAGRSFFAVAADGSFTPCLYMEKNAETPSTGYCNTENIVDFWEKSSVLGTLRCSGEGISECANCCFQRRCLHCQAWGKDITCPVYHAL